MTQLPMVRERSWRRGPAVQRSSSAAFVTRGIGPAFTSKAWSSVAPAEKRTRSSYDREYQVQGDEL